jgi:hypothetical protein
MTSYASAGSQRCKTYNPECDHFVIARRNLRQECTVYDQLTNSFHPTKPGLIYTLPI